MPIEIKEMHIKINVDDSKKSSTGSSGSSDGVVQECLDQVAKMLNNKNER